MLLNVQSEASKSGASTGTFSSSRVFQDFFGMDRVAIVGIKHDPKIIIRRLCGLGAVGSGSPMGAVVGELKFPVG
jgi:hypothetical protein